MARTKIENDELELVGVDGVLERGQEAPAMPPKAAPAA